MAVGGGGGVGEGGAAVDVGRTGMAVAVGNGGTTVGGGGGIVGWLPPAMGRLHPASITATKRNRPIERNLRMVFSLGGEEKCCKRLRPYKGILQHLCPLNSASSRAHGNWLGEMVRVLSMVSMIVSHVLSGMSFVFTMRMPTM